MIKALEDLRGSDDNQHRPFLTLRIAALFADLDHSVSVATLRESIQGFNAAAFSDEKWSQTVLIGKIAFSLPIVTEGVANVQSSFGQLYNSDPEAAMSALLELKPERLKEQGLIAAAQSILKA